ncbi:MAG: gluconate 2-dehydrogenase subunit 3 family protein [Sphingobacteriaceae bacterium]|nr:MAG: gluconate 2-dehydrogenase subunit 3 family protein [Sphingobacteriaceae bacterium]
MIKETFNNLLNSDQVTAKTKEVLLNREVEKFYYPTFFTSEEFELLQLVCDQLVAQTEQRLVDIASKIDKRLTEKTGPGWRYDSLPPDGVSYKTGLKGISEAVLFLSHKKFNDLSSEKKDQLLKSVQQDDAPGETWKNFSGKRFFELLLTETTEHFYSHPNAQAEINYIGFADADGWQVPQI